MAGHVFVVRGDMKELACDAWLLPVDQGFHVTSNWADAIGTSPGHLKDQEKWADGERVRRLRAGSMRAPEIWLGNVGASGKDAAWYAEASRSFIRTAAPAIAAKGGSRPPLLAINHLGTGLGGARERKGDVLAALFTVLYDTLVTLDIEVDVAVVSWTAAAHAAAQRARLHALCGEATPSLKRAIDAWDFADEDCAPRLRATARALADRADERHLTVFMGAGVSAGAGLPSWDDLLEELGRRLDPPVSRDQLRRLNDPRDRAAFLDIQYRNAGDDLHEALRDALGGSAYSLQHALLSSFPIEEFITTNFDELFETAARAGDRRLRVLPASADSDDTDRWLLKLHGTVSDSKSIVLTRGAYIEAPAQRGALLGLVQAMLMTKHMLFVGYGLGDDDFHEVIHQVRTAYPSSVSNGPLGTALTLVHDDVRARLWANDVEVVAVLSEDRPSLEETIAVGGREVEKFLDLIGLLTADRTAFLLDPEYSGMLDANEVALARLLMPLVSVAHPDGEHDGWRALAGLLESLGARRSGTTPPNDHPTASSGSRNSETVDDLIPGTRALTGDPRDHIGTGPVTRLLSEPPTWTEVADLRLDQLRIAPHLGPKRIERFLDQVRAAVRTAAVAAATPPLSIAEACSELLNSFDARDRAILERRVLPVEGAAPTLAELGEEFGLTRERVRQREVRAIARIDALLSESRFLPLVERAEVVRSAVGAFAPLDEAPDDVRPDPTSLVDEIIAHIAGPYRIVDGWIGRRGLGSPESVVLDAFRRIEDHGIAMTEALRGELESMEIHPSLLERLLTNTERLRPVEDFVVDWTVPLDEKAVAALRIAGRPMTTDEIVAVVQPINQVSLTNQLSTNDQILRVGRGRWALADWGLDSYQGIVPAMVDRLVDGPRSIDELAQEIADEYGVSPASVRIHSSLHPAFVSEHGMVRLRGSHEPYTPRATLETSPGCAIDQQGQWSYRMTIDHDVVRGSGKHLPEAFAAHIGAVPLETVSLESDFGQFRVRWDQAPGISSLRRLVQKLGGELGDTLVITARGDGRLGFSLDDPARSTM